MATQKKEKRKLIIPSPNDPKTTTKAKTLSPDYMLDKPEILQNFIHQITQLEYQLELLLASVEHNRIKTPLR